MTLAWSLASMVWLSGDGEHESPVRVFEGGWQSTEALVLDANLRDQVDDLAKSEEIDAEATGIGGDRSDIWLQYRRLLDASSKAERLALLHHRSAIVRGYLAEHVVWQMPEELDKVYPLLRDTTQLLARNGCSGAHVSIADHVLEAIIAAVRKEPPVHDSGVLARIAEDGALAVPLRAEALRWLAFVNGSAASAVAHRAMAGEPGRYRETGRLALGQLGDAADVERIASDSASSDPAVRENTAMALGMVASPKARDELWGLVRDPDERVRASAVAGYAAQPSADPNKLRALGANLAVLPALIEKNPEIGLELLEGSLVEGKPDTLTERDVTQLFDGVKSPAGLERLRHLLRSKDVEVKRAAIVRLGQTKDAGSLADIRELAKDGHFELQAVPALGALGDRQSIPLFLRLLKHDGPVMRGLAATALGAVGAKEALPALKAAAANEGSFAKEEMEAAIASLAK